MREIRTLSSGAYRLQLDEYYQLGLYDPVRNADALSGKYVGRASWPSISLRFNKPKAIAAMPDRHDLLRLLARWNVPVPKTLAVFNRSDESKLHDQIIDAQGLHRFLRSEEGSPSVGKPLTRKVRAGASLITGYNADGDFITLEGHKRVMATTFLNAVQRGGYNGYLFEEFLRPHQGLAEHLGNRLVTVRMTILRSAKDAIVFRPVLKIPGIAVEGSSNRPEGDLVAGVNSKTGELLPAIRRNGPAHQSVLRHPETNAVITDAEVPDWRDIVYMVKRGAGLFPELQIQRWDVAITDKGPVVLDVGANLDIHTAQKAWGRGLLDGPLGTVISRVLHLNQK